jgi:predicted  nucleic acid-binding Zn-ribbon protein
MNDEHIKLSDTSVKMINKKINDINYMMKNISNDINTEELSHHMKKCYCSLLESYSKELFSYLDYDSDLAKDLNNRHESLKNANEKIRELETQIGNKIGDLDVIHGVSRISETMKEWWFKQLTKNLLKSIHFRNLFTVISF